MSEEEGGIRLALDVFVQLTVSVLIFLAVFSYIQSIYTDDTFEREYLAKDIALEVEAIQVPQGNSVVAYRKDTNNYDFFFRENKVEVFESIDGQEPSAYLKAVSGFSVYDDINFRDSEQSILGLGLKPTLLKTDNKISALLPGEQYSLELYSYGKTDTSKEPKDYIFFVDSGDEELTGSVSAAVESMNYLLETKFSYSKNNPSFLISKSKSENLIYAPKNPAKRKLAILIANRFIEKGQDFLILPSYDNIFRIEMKEGLEKELSQILKESFEEYYKNE
jgi:hypothetical protein